MGLQQLAPLAELTGGAVSARVCVWGMVCVCVCVCERDIESVCV